MASQNISERFNDKARQLLDYIHRQRPASSALKDAARDLIKSIYKLEGNGGLPPPKIEPLPASTSRHSKANAIRDPWLHWNTLQGKDSRNDGSLSLSAA
jgi:hypothetical protein